MDSKNDSKSPYPRFFAMTASSGVLMYGLMYLHTYAWDHVFFSQTRLWMTLIMVAVMAVVMLTFMLGMYRNRAMNLAIYGGAILLFLASLGLVRSQETVGDIAYMKGMIPHHSIAILTSRRAHISDPRVRELANGIIEAQVREIDEMKALIADIEANGDAPGELAPVR
ncbi:DUF305 domain-containing protein [Alteraurantiacibacter aquimixticola]|uniref:DUF305 domain-containing protein n=1 Tax=Alteraurantiacibacter aquimixticola TaxID=2489173 RepID=A0A4V4U8S9_9SPHN|nr:DUF305 domain-containing protein [Alteraurantiacibacter aquimixticola]TIX48997.1 DUF305 domain-containing protein [Alteraurantiacibacter aquimixticola]